MLQIDITYTAFDRIREKKEKVWMLNEPTAKTEEICREAVGLRNKYRV